VPGFSTFPHCEGSGGPVRRYDQQCNGRLREEGCQTVKRVCERLAYSRHPCAEVLSVAGFCAFPTLFLLRLEGELINVAHTVLLLMAGELSTLCTPSSLGWRENYQRCAPWEARAGGKTSTLHTLGG